MNECCPVCGGHHDHHQPHQLPADKIAGACGCGGDHAEHDHGPDHSACGGEHEEDDPDPPAAEACGCGHDHGDYDPADLSGVPVTADGVAVYRIDNMDCPMEEALIRDKLKGMSGVTGLEFNLIKRVLTVRHELESLDKVEAALNSIDMKPVAITAGQPVEEAGPPKSQWKRLLIAGILALGAEAAHFAYGDHLAVLVLAVAAILLGGLQTYKKGWIALKNLNLNMNALMSFAVTGALIIKQWPEAAMVMVLFTLAEAIEAKSLAKARTAIAGLLNLTPETATVKQENGNWAETRADQVAVGGLVRVRPGERVALDGRIVSGSSTLNQSPITGESLPVEKTVGDQVFAGTINESGSFEFEVTSAFADSTLARIIKAVEEAQSSRAPIQRFVDKFASVYTPIVFVLAILVGVLPPLLMDGQWLDWAYKALVLLVIACPCALVISTPVTIVSGLAAATRHGLLVKGGAFLEQGRKLKWIALDKTGTITKGRPEQTDFRTWGTADPERTRRLAASLAARSDHPVSKAIASAAEKDGVVLAEVEKFTALPGFGVSGRIDGETLYLANHKLIHNEGWCSDELEKAIEGFEVQGKSVVGLFSPGGVMGLLAVADGLKDNSREAIVELQALGLKTMMLTGDNETVARSVAVVSGVDRFRGDLLPQDKSAAIEELKNEGPVGMVGDGINDAPALAVSDIGFAMGAAGTDTAIETADVALMDDDLKKLPAFIRLSRSTHSILWQNIGLALGIKAVFFALTFMDYTTMWMAVFADIGVSLMVVANGLRMLRK